MSEKGRINNSDNPLTSLRTDGGKNTTETLPSEILPYFIFVLGLNGKVTCSQTRNVGSRHKSARNTKSKSSAKPDDDEQILDVSSSSMVTMKTDPPAQQHKQDPNDHPGGSSKGSAMSSSWTFSIFFYIFLAACISRKDE